MGESKLLESVICMMPAAFWGKTAQGNFEQPLSGLVSYGRCPWVSSKEYGEDLETADGRTQLFCSLCLAEKVQGLSQL